MLILAFGIAAVLAGVDQLIKLWMIQNLKPVGEMEFLRIGNLDILHLYYTENTGSAFSMMAGQRVWLLIASVAGILACSFVLVRYARKRPTLYWSMVLIIGGALGNLIDRMFRGGAVVDFLDIQLFRFAVFNFADCCVTVGTVLLFIYILFSKEEKQAVPEQEASDGEA